MSGENCFGHTFQLSLIEDLDVSTDVQEFNICKTFIKGLAFESTDNLLEKVRNLINDWNDNEISGQIVVSVESQPNRELIVTAINPESNQKLLKALDRHLSSDSGLKWIEVKE